jgi:hypothetical protein
MEYVKCSPEVTEPFLCTDTRENVYTESVRIIPDFIYLDVMVYQYWHQI